MLVWLQIQTEAEALTVDLNDTKNSQFCCFKSMPDASGKCIRFEKFQWKLLDTHHQTIFLVKSAIIRIHFDIVSSIFGDLIVELKISKLQIAPRSKLERLL